MKHWMTMTVVSLLPLLIPSRSAASDAKMVNGAATLPQKSFAASIDAGFDTPEPIFAGLRLDYGATDRYQVGVSVAYWVLIGTATMHNRLNLVQSSDQTHFLSAEFDIGFMHIENIFNLPDIEALTLRPALAYEVRPGSAKRTGIFFKGGTYHVYAGDEHHWGNALGDKRAKWANVARLTAGVQQQFGDVFSLTIQGSLHVPHPFPLGKLGFTFAF